MSSYCHCGKKLSRLRYKNCNEHKYTKENRKKMSDARKGRFGDEKHPLWKGQKAGYRAAHYWIVRKLGKPNKCSKCGKRGIGHGMHWANISRNYKRVISDWVRLCAKCHGEFDRGHRRNRKPIKTI